MSNFHEVIKFAKNNQVFLHPQLQLLIFETSRKTSEPILLEELLSYSGLDETIKNQILLTGSTQEKALLLARDDTPEDTVEQILSADSKVLLEALKISNRDILIEKGCQTYQGKNKNLFNVLISKHQLSENQTRTLVLEVIKTTTKFPNGVRQKIESAIKNAPHDAILTRFKETRNEQVINFFHWLNFEQRKELILNKEQALTIFWELRKNPNLVVPGDQMQQIDKYLLSENNPQIKELLVAEKYRYLRDFPFSSEKALKENPAYQQTITSSYQQPHPQNQHEDPLILEANLLNPNLSWEETIQGLRTFNYKFEQIKQRVFTELLRRHRHDEKKLLDLYLHQETYSVGQNLKKWPLENQEVLNKLFFIILERTHSNAKLPSESLETILQQTPAQKRWELVKHIPYPQFQTLMEPKLLLEIFLTHQEEELGTNSSRWEIFYHLGETFQGTIGELFDSTKALT